MSTLYPVDARPKTVLLIPLKAFDNAKERLSDHVSPEDRAELARSMATTVISAAGDLGVWVVCDDHEVAAFAANLGSNVVWRSGGLNGAVQGALGFFDGQGVDRVIVAHGDLPNATSFDDVLAATQDNRRAVALVTDRNQDGTNVLSLPTGTDFRVRYGSQSYEKHLREAARIGLPVVTVIDEDLALDIDFVSDLELLRERP